jgi:hypothetical protein
MRHLLPAIAVVVVLGGATVVPKTVLAQQDNGTLSVEAENDYFSPDNRDRHYTNGLRLAWLPEPDPSGQQDFLERLANSIPYVGDPDTDGRIGWSLGQSLFTPQNKTTSLPITNDRPYAGWLYAGVSLIKAPDTPVQAKSGISELDTLEVDLGVVGRAALGEQVQNSFHAFAFGNEHVYGWRNQLKSEPGLLITYDHKWRALAQTQFLGLGADLTPDAGFHLGNVEIDAAAGATLRVGRDLPADYGPPRIQPGLAGSDFVLPDSTTGRDFGWYFFAGAEGRAVGHDIFLDGNTFATSLSVPKKTFVADLQAGVALLVYGVRLTATEVVRTQEFHGQHGPDEFGSISASFEF